MAQDAFSGFGCRMCALETPSAFLRTPPPGRPTRPGPRHGRYLARDRRPLRSGVARCLGARVRLNDLNAALQPCPNASRNASTAWAAKMQPRSAYTTDPSGSGTRSRASCRPPPMRRYPGAASARAAHATMHACATPEPNWPAGAGPAVKTLKRPVSEFPRSHWQQLPVMLNCWYAYHECQSP